MGYISAKEFAAKRIIENPNKANRALSEEFGIGYETIRRARASSPTDPFGSVEKTIGRDGKKRPARMTKEKAVKIRNKAKAYQKRLAP